jgi:serine protease Do
MRDSNEQQREYEYVEENHDGRTMIVMALCGAVICGVLAAAGFAVFSFLFDKGDANLTASIELGDVTLGVDIVDAVPVASPNSVAAEPASREVTEVVSSDGVESSGTKGRDAQSTVAVPAVKPEPPAVESAADSDTTSKPAAVVPATASAEVAAVTPTPSVATPVSATPLADSPKVPTADGKATAGDAASATKGSASGTPLSYRWNPGEIQGYTVSMTATVNDQKQTVAGTVELTCDEQPAKVDTKAVEKTRKPDTGTGTGFVVSADGHLITCAHVIQGADLIEVWIQGKTQTARVVAVEPDDDVALLKIEAVGLPALSLADSGKVRLGEEVRAIGFPLSTVLGNGIKVTRGIVAGVVERDEGKRFQIDAAVNPGNSGGPVVNTRGQVLGVASSKLVGLELMRVGFCVPAARALSLLKANDVKPVDSGLNEDLDGPGLVEAVSPSVALITVTIDPQKVSGKLVQIRTSGSFRTKSQPRGRTRPSFSFPNMTFNSGLLNVDTYGNVASFSAPNQLPFLAGPMSLLTIHQFDPSGRRSWTVRDRIKVTVQQDSSPFGRRRIPIPIPRGPRFGPRIRNPFAPKTVKEFEALEVHQYRITSDSDDQVVLEKTFTLTTLDDDEAPYFRITGKGEVIFSRRLGLVESFEFDHHFEQNAGEKTVRIPVEIAVKRQGSAVVAQRQRDAAVAQAKVEHANAVKAANKAVVPPGERLDALLQKLKAEAAKGGYPSSQLTSLAKFEVIPERRDEVEALLVNLLESKQYLTVRGALGSLEKWGTSNSVPAITAQLKHSMFPVVQAAIKALGTFRDERSVAPLIETLRKSQIARHDVKGALTRMGKSAEEPVIAMLFEEDRQLFQTACDILKTIGSEDSVESLESIVNGKDFFRKSYAGRSLTSVKSRLAAAKAVAASGNAAPTDPSAPKVEAVLKAMNNPPDQSGYARTSALMKLGAPTDYKRDELEDALLKSLADANFAVQHQGMMALQKRATQRSVTRLLKLFADPDSKLQFMAAQTLRKTGVGADGEGMLVGEISKASRKIRKAIIDLLTEIGSPESLEALDELANSPHATSIQYAAARAAARIRLRADLPISS